MDISINELLSCNIEQIIPETNRDLMIICYSKYSAVPNKRTVWNNPAGYYIGLFEH